MGKPSRPRSNFPYYKVHVFDKKNLAWIDARKEAFDSLNDAKLYISEKLSKRKSRILIVTERGRKVYREQ